jgi:hypothetical protein
MDAFSLRKPQPGGWARYLNMHPALMIALAVIPAPALAAIQRLLQIGNDILGGFDSDGQPQ